MGTLLMAGFNQTKLPTRAIREAARSSDDPMAERLSTGRIQPWDLFSLRASAVPGAAEWANKALDTLVAGVGDRYKDTLDCQDCLDVGFYGLTSSEDPDILTSLIRRVDSGGYEQLTASGSWQPYAVLADQYLEVLTRELAGDLAEAVTAGASGMARRYFWPLAFLPPGTMIAAAPAPELVNAHDVAVDSQDALDPEDVADGGWVSYAVVDDLDPGAVLDLIRLRRGPAGPELAAYRNGAWSEAPEILTDLQGVQPPPLVELSGDQLANVLSQIDSEGSEDSGDPGEGLDETDKRDDEGAQAVAAAMGLTAASTSLPEGGFPIASRGDLKKAVQAFGRAKNPTAAKRHIIKRARALSAVSMLPKSWGVTASGTTRLMALVADAPLTVSPDPRAEKLRRYWTTGKGALKIRWGTSGDWTRCYRQLRKHMGMAAKGYCQNLHKRATGQWTGSRLNAGGSSRSALAASGTSGAQSMEAALVAAVSTGRWFSPEGGNAMLKDGIYAEGGNDVALLRTLTAGGFPVAPPDEWFDNPELDGPTPLTVDDDGRVYGHIATRDVAHIGLPGRVHAPRSRSNYAYFKTGQLVTASGKKINVGQLTLAGGHAPLSADASAAVAHYDNTASAVVDVNCGDDKHGIWVAGALRPEVTPSQLRVLRASAPSGDWRPINGQLELVACCQVNVPGFPVVRARVASGAITSLVAAGAGPLYARRLALMADASVAERLTAMEQVVFAQMTEGLENPEDVLTADGEIAAEVGEGEPLSADQVAAEGLEEAPEEKPISDAVKRAREAVAARKAASEGEPTSEVPAEPTEATQTADAEVVKAERLAALRARVHGTSESVAASAGK